MFYHISKDHCIVGDSIPEVLCQLDQPPRWNLHYLEKLLQHGLWLDSGLAFQTQFQDVFRIPPGYQFSDQYGEPKLIQQWTLESGPSNSRLSLEAAQEQLLEQLEQAVLRVTKSRRVGLELSGGLDSSTVSAVTRKLYPNSTLHAFTHMTPNNIPSWMRSASFLYDESKWSRTVSNHLGLEQHRVGSSFHLDEVIERYSECLGGCSEVLFPLLNHEVYSQANKLQLTTLLSGFGGDEVVSQHANDALTEWCDQGAYGRYLYERAMRKYRSLSFNLGCDGHPSVGAARHKQVNSHWPFLFLDSVDSPKVVPSFRTIQAKEAAYVQGELSIHWQRRIETTKVIAKHYGIDCAFPLADPQLMQFFHQLPARFKRRHGYGRYLLRSSIRDYLPASVVWRCDKAGATAPAANANLIAQLPECFLNRVDSNYDGILKPYVNLPKLCQLFESGPTLDNGIVRLAVTVLMVLHYESRLN